MSTTKTGVTGVKTHIVTTLQVPLKFLDNEQNSFTSRHLDKFIKPQERIVPYCLGTRDFAGDMEMDRIFIQDNVRNTITIISHLEKERQKQVLNFFLHFLHNLIHNYTTLTVQFLTSVAVFPEAKIKL